MKPNITTAEFDDTDVARFATKIDMPADDNGCWMWKGARHGQGRGYGKFRLGGKPVNAHRASYIMFVGEVPAGYVLGHQCNNEACVNPMHLKAETQSSNMKYCVASGRHNSQKRAK